eukprot:2859788-Karenia_brevis.AAC.1
MKPWAPFWLKVSFLVLNFSLPAQPSGRRFEVRPASWGLARGEFITHPRTARSTADRGGYKFTKGFGSQNLANTA